MYVSLVLKIAKWSDICSREKKINSDESRWIREQYKNVFDFRGKIKAEIRIIGCLSAMGSTLWQWFLIF